MGRWLGLAYSCGVGWLSVFVSFHSSTLFSSKNALIISFRYPQKKFSPSSFQTNLKNSISVTRISRTFNRDAEITQIISVRSCGYSGDGVSH